MKEIKYQGSKSRIAKYIVPIIQECIDNNEITEYYEPFVGGGNVIDKIACESRFGSDSNKYLIALLNHVSHGGNLYPDVSRELYNFVRSKYNEGANDIPDWYIGNIGFLASYNGRWFDGGFAAPGYENTKNGTRYRDYYQEAKRNLEAQATKLTDVTFSVKDYSEVTPHGSFVYCDPPYANTKQYKNSRDFDFEKFWDYIRQISKDNFVLVSELNAPDDFNCIWAKEVSRSIKATDKSKATEKLFTYNKGKYAQMYKR